MNAYHKHLPGNSKAYGDDGKELKNKVRCIDCDLLMDRPPRGRHDFKDYDECAHVWAQQKVGWGKKYRLYFEGRSIWSYGSHFEIARFISPREVLFTTRDYSNTTTKHKWAVRRAISHLTVYEVCSFDDFNETALDLAGRVKYRISSAKREFIGLDAVLKYIAETKSGIRRVLKRFGREMSAASRAKLRAALTLRFTRAEIKAIREKQARYAMAIQRRRAAESAAEIEVLHTRALQENQARPWLEDITELTRIAWLNGADVNINLYDMPVMLRLVGDEIETSHGALVPVERALDLWDRMQKKRPLHGFEIGHYTVTGLVDGNLVIGCHKIPIREVCRMAVHLGLETA